MDGFCKHFVFTVSCLVQELYVCKNKRLAVLGLRVHRTHGRGGAAEQWYSKALDVRWEADDRPGLAIILNNLADLLANDPARLDEARGLAEEGLAISETLDPAAMQIWTTYELLACIADRQGDSSRAAEYRTKAERAFAPYRGGE